MSINIHDLQKESWLLLRELYTRKKLPLTKGMLTVSRGYYPSIEDVLHTLAHYRDDELVIAFADKSAAIIEDAKREIESRKEASQETPASSAKDEDGIDLWLSLDGNWVDAFQSMKSVPIKEIEEAMSTELSRVCGVDLAVEIKGLNALSGVESLGASFSATVKPKSVFR